MEKGKRFPPLFITDKYRERNDYTIPKTGRDEDKKKKTQRDRALHGGFIKRQLTRAWGKAATSRKAVGAVTSKGVYLEFEIDSNSDVPISPLDSSGWELRNIRVDHRDHEKLRIATVFIPLAK